MSRDYFRRTKRLRETPSHRIVGMISTDPKKEACGAYNAAGLLFRNNELNSLKRFRRVAFNRTQVEIHRVLGYLQQFRNMLHGIFHIKHTLLIEYFNNRAIV